MEVFTVTPVVERIASPFYHEKIGQFNRASHDKIKLAYMYAAGAHAAVRQKRKYTNEDYIVHPVEVMNILMCAEFVDVDMAQAALLHDTVEDTGLEFEDILKVFGRGVVDHLYYLTDRSVQLRLKGVLNRKGRKAVDLAHYEDAPASTRTIKVADLISNSCDITKHDESFARQYLREKEDMLKVIGQGADPLLVAFAWKLLEEGKDKLGI